MAGCLMEKDLLNIRCQRVISDFFFIFGGVHRTGLMANLYLTFVMHRFSKPKTLK